MFGRKILKGAFALAVTGIAMPVLAGTAGASASPNLSFSSSTDGASAGWTSGRGSTIELTLGTSPGSYAIVDLHHEDGVAVANLAEPTFSTDNFNAGSPRYYITFSDRNSVWGYPPNAGLNGTDFAWEMSNSGATTTWDAVQATEGAATVTGAYVIADADQSALTVDHIDGLSFAGTTFNS